MNYRPSADSRLPAIPQAARLQRSSLIPCGRERVNRPPSFHTPVLLYWCVLFSSRTCLRRRIIILPHASAFFGSVGAGVAILCLLRFLRSNDEREQQIKYRALTFAFMGILVFSAIGYLQTFGFHSMLWLGIPGLMICLWSFGLILYSRRYR